MKHNPVKPTKTFNDLEKIDIRVGIIEKVEDVTGSDKLLRLIINFGEFSEGMLFDIGYANGITPVLALPEKPVLNDIQTG